jgi:hypothetical protein
LPVKSNSIELQYLGKVDPNQVVEINANASLASPQGIASVANASNSLNATPPIVYMGSYNASGVPSYKESQRDAISATLLAYINASLPERQPVPEFHPTYIANGKKTTLDIIELADLWITFVHEGAGWRNAIGFYTYPTATPPQSLSDINQVNVAFPNLSFKGSGVKLVTGDKINLGRYQPGTSIAPTDLADESFFGTGDNNSDKNTGSYYKSKTSLPWGIHLPESFDYPMERVDIRDGHLRFKDWASSYGYSYMDWYRDQTGYRNTNKIFRSSK